MKLSLYREPQLQVGKNYIYAIRTKRQCNMYGNLINSMFTVISVKYSYGEDEWKGIERLKTDENINSLSQ